MSHTIAQVTLELLRPGPSHNQLLSPLTSYVALSGPAGPNTFSVPIEHRELLRQLDQVTRGRDQAQRTAQLSQTAAVVEGLLASLPALHSELARAAGQDADLIHLRLVLSPAELALLPFEAALVPEGLPGEKTHLSLQPVRPVVITRETRHHQDRHDRAFWERPPRVLIAAASPAGLPPVPLRAHLLALRRAIDPWVDRHRDPASGALCATADTLLHVLPAATISSLREACASHDFTHVHLLAHGVPMPGSHGERFGLALHDEHAPGRAAVTDGQALVAALRARRSEGEGCSQPLQVTLASCDSGNVGGVIAPGASIAHDLHVAGIPWVIASQFPLSFAGSALVCEVLHTRLLRGDDPRVVIHDLRQRLRAECPDSHDWASVVVYARADQDFAEDWAWYRHRRTMAAVESAFHDLHQAVEPAVESAAGGADEPAIDELMARVDHWTGRLEDEAERSESLGDHAMNSEARGLMASNFKRKARVQHRRGRTADERAALTEARRHYQSASRARASNHWTVVQYVSLDFVLEGRVPQSWWHVGKAMTMLDLEAGGRSELAWAHGSLAELQLLALAMDDRPDSVTRLKEEAVESCQRIVRLMGAEAFHVESTLRQVRRYLDWWLPALEAAPPDGPLVDARVLKRLRGCAEDMARALGG